MTIGILLAAIEDPASTDGNEAQTMPLRHDPELTLRDEANAITAHAFRNGFLEHLHAGRWSPILSDPGFSRITDDEMKKLMIETSARLAHWLYLREIFLDEKVDLYFQLVATVRSMFARKWDRAARACDLPHIGKTDAPLCPSCHATLHDAWRFCPLCGSAAASASP
jgi:hypothetical protein